MTPVSDNQVKNTISVDVEEYFHATNLEPVAPPAKWHALESRVEHSTRRILELLSAGGTRGTFFILGYVARRHPALVKEIAAAGHEIGSHGYSHRLAYNQTPAAFYRDVYRTRRLLEQQTGTPVLGYRAPSFSITDRNPWAHEMLARAGYAYDSSSYPTWHPRYGHKGKSRAGTILETPAGTIYELPLAVASINLLGRDVRLPVAGGAYWRIFPRSFISWGLSRINRVDRLPCHCYLHPWEIDADQPVFESLSFLTKLRHYSGVQELPSKLSYWLRLFNFSPFCAAVPELREIYAARAGDAALMARTTQMNAKQ